MSTIIDKCQTAETATIAVGNRFAIINAGDVAAVSGFKWHIIAAATKTGCRFYAATNNPDRRGQKLFMHRIILGVSSGTVDHKNGDGLDNRRCNIRQCTPTQNLANTKKAPGKSSMFKGVAFHKPSRKWQAKICYDWKQRHLGMFDLEIDAAMAYDDAAIKNFGEFAVLNFPDRKPNEPQVEKHQDQPVAQY